MNNCGNFSNIGSNCTTVKTANQLLIVNEIRRNKELSRTDLAKALQLSNPSVAKNVEELTERGIIEQLGFVKTNIGRRPLMLRFNQNCGCVGAISFTHGNGVTLCIADMDGDIIDMLEIDGLSVMGVDMFSQTIELFSSLLVKNAKKCGPLKCICIGTPGIIEPATGKIIYALQISNYASIDLKAMFFEHFGVPVLVKNDVNLAASGEHLYGYGMEHANLMYISVDKGVGAGLVLGNSVYEGARGYAGEIGMIETELSKRSLVGGSKLITSLKSELIPVNLIRRIADAFDCDEPTLLHNYVRNGGEIRIEHVAKALEDNDPLCCRIVGNSARMLAATLFNMNRVLDLELFVIGGSVVKFGNFYLNEIKKIFSGDTLGENIKIEFSQLKNMAPIYGAIGFAADYALKLMVEQCL